MRGADLRCRAPLGAGSPTQRGSSAMRRTLKQSVVATVAALSTITAVLALPSSPASADPPPVGSLGQFASAEGCVQDVADLAAAAQETCGPARALKAAGAVQVTPNGQFAYVAGTDGGGSINGFARDAVTGALTQLPGSTGCLAAAAFNGCGVVAGLGGLASILVSHDGSRLFVANPVTARVLILGIGSDGGLSSGGASHCISNSPAPSSSCSAGSGIPRPDA